MNLLRLVTIVAASLALAGAAFAQDNNEGRDNDVQFELRAELGFVALLKHTIQFGYDGTNFDYISEGGQDNLFNFARLTAEIPIGDRHQLILLAQPLAFNTFVNLKSDQRFDGIDFPEGTPTRILYDFGFWRGSYLYRVHNGNKHSLALGLSLQLRNARIEFASDDGTLLSSNRGVGPVPILKGRWHHLLPNDWWQEVELDGFYAPVSYLNGDNNDIIGSILDANYRVGMNLPQNAQAFLNLRYLGGGAQGVDDDDQRTEGDDGYTENWIHALSITLGLGYQF